jgi:hypothetical protein
MATEQQEHLKIEQLRQHSADELETIAGREKENLEGWIPSLASEAEVREALEKAFDYRGDVTITLKNGEKVEGYLFDRRSGSSLSDSFVRVIPTNVKTKVNVSYADIAALAFTGRDTAAGKTFEAWVKKYWEKKASKTRPASAERSGTGISFTRNDGQCAYSSRERQASWGLMWLAGTPLRARVFVCLPVRRAGLMHSPGWMRRLLSATCANLHRCGQRLKGARRSFMWLPTTGFGCAIRVRCMRRTSMAHASF